MTKLSKSLTGIVVAILFSITLVNAEEYTITETFDDVVIGTEGTVVDYDIIADAIPDDTTVVPPTTIYKKYSIEGTCGAELIVKEQSRSITPYINSEGVYVTGNSNRYSAGENRLQWYILSGLRYKLPQTCNSMSIAYEYFNLDDEEAYITIVLQRVNDNNEVVWETTKSIATHDSRNIDWRDKALNAAWFDQYIQGHEFNVVWFLSTNMGVTSSEGSYVDNLNITLNTVEPIIVADGTNCETEIEELILESDVLVTQIVTLEKEIAELKENSNATDNLASIFAEACPEEYAWKNHGQYVKCMTQLKNKLIKEYRASLKGIVKTAVKSDIGKK